jgi:hypothetical protein
MKKQPEETPEFDPYEPIEKPTWEMTDAELAQHEAEMDAAMGWSAGAPLSTATPNAEPLDDEDEDENGDLIERISPTDYRTLAEADAEAMAAIGDDDDEEE